MHRVHIILYMQLINQSINPYHLVRQHANLVFFYHGMHTWQEQRDISHYFYKQLSRLVKGTALIRKSPRGCAPPGDLQPEGLR